MFFTCLETPQPPNTSLLKSLQAERKCPSRHFASCLDLLFNAVQEISLKNSHFKDARNLQQWDSSALKFFLSSLQERNLQWASSAHKFQIVKKIPNIPGISLVNMVQGREITRLDHKSAFWKLRSGQNNLSSKSCPKIFF